MAAFNADVLLDLVTSRAERELKKFERNFDRLERKTSNLDVGVKVDSSQIRRAERELKRLERTRRAAVGVSGTGGGGGGGDSDAAFGGLFGGSLATFTQRRKKTLEDYSRVASEVANSDAEVIRTQKELEAQYDKVAAKEKKLADARRNLKSVTDGFANKGRSLKQSLNDANNAVRRNTGDLERYNRELAELNDNFVRAASNATQKGIGAADRQLGTQRRQADRRALLGSAGAGLAFANLPGQDIGFAAATGAALGGPKGAALAAAVATLAKLGSLAPGIAKTSAEIERFNVALTNVAGSRSDEAFEAIRGVVDDFNAPLKEATGNFTQLLAAAKSAGFSVAETEQVFRGLSAANAALGGDNQKLQGILLATTQVFSKGKVAAEELRGQIGERLPGAFSKFAEATGRSTAELDKALERGEVSLQDFVTFAASLLDEYEDDAKRIADGPTAAGQRLDRALTDLQRAIGPTLAAMGAAFQNFATEAITQLTRVFTFLGQLDQRISGTGGLEGAQQLLQNATEWRDSLQQLLIDPNTAQERIPDLVENLAIAERNIADAQAALDKFKLGPAVPEASTTPTTPTDPTKPGGSAVDTLSKQLESGKDLSREFSRQLQLLEATEGLERELLQIRFDQEDRMRRIADAAADQRAELTALSDDLAAAEAGTAIGNALAQDLIDLETSLKSALDSAQSEFSEFFSNLPINPLEQALKLSADRIAVALNDTIGVAIEGLITGADDLNESLQNIASSLLRDIGSALVRIGIGGIGTIGSPGTGSGLLGQIFNRESGGPCIRQPSVHRRREGARAVRAPERWNDLQPRPDAGRNGDVLAGQHHFDGRRTDSVREHRHQRSGVRHPRRGRGHRQPRCPGRRSQRCEAGRNAGDEPPPPIPLHPLEGGPVRKIEDQVYKARMLSIAVQMGTFEPIDCFAVPEIWLTMIDGLICCMAIAHKDLLPEEDF